jgi:RNA polymerase sigma factor (sigma-70 family)
MYHILVVIGDDMPEDYFKIRMEAKLKNSLLKEAREKLGLTQKQVGDIIGVNTGTYSQIECMQRYPSSKIAEEICDFYQSNGIVLDPRKVFPESLRNMHLQRMYVATKEVTSPQLESIVEQHNLLAESIEKKIEQEDKKRIIYYSLDVLSERQREVIKRYYGLEPYEEKKSLEEIGEMLNMTGSNVARIRDKAIRRLRYYHSKKLRIFL